VPTPTPTKTPTLTFTPTETPTRTPTATPTPFGPGSFKGSYSLRFFGKTGGGAPDAGTGIVIGDGVGNVSGNLTENKDGAVCEFTLKGTYTVNPDGTGSITANGTPIGTGCTGNTSAQASVLVDAGKGVLTVQISGRGPVLGILTKQ
jgi:hypothetical protein